MNRLHIRMQELNHPQFGTIRQFYLADAPPPGSYPGCHDNITPCTIDPTDPPISRLRAKVKATRLVEDAGKHVMGELIRNHEINSALGHAINVVGSAGVSHQTAICLELCSDWAEDFPWEALLDSNAHGDFLACLPETQVGRLVAGTRPVDRMLDGSDTTRRPVLRLLAFLATGDSAADRAEWKKLYQVKLDADASNVLEIDLDVLVCDPNLFTAINKALQHHSGSSQVELIVAKPSVQDAIRRRPHIIHFFGRGAKGAVPYLELATMSWARAPSIKPVRITAKELRHEILKNAPDHVWQVVLNCCNGAAGAIGGQSIAKALVGSQVPVVIGMSEPIDRDPAHVFTGAYYAELVAQVRNHIPSQTTPRGQVEWVNALYSPRRDLLEDATGRLVSVTTASAYKIWSLPILYTLTQRFRFGTTELIVDGQVAESTKADVGAELRAIPGAPTALVQELGAMIGVAEDENNRTA